MRTIGNSCSSSLVACRFGKSPPKATGPLPIPSTLLCATVTLNHILVAACHLAHDGSPKTPSVLPVEAPSPSSEGLVLVNNLLSALPAFGAFISSLFTSHLQADETGNYGRSTHRGCKMFACLYLVSLSRLVTFERTKLIINTFISASQDPDVGGHDDDGNDAGGDSER